MTIPLTFRKNRAIIPLTFRKNRTITKITLECVPFNYKGTHS